MRFSTSSQISIPEKSIFGHLGSCFSTYNFFQGLGGYFLLVHSKRSTLTKS